MSNYTKWMEKDWECIEVKALALHVAGTALNPWALSGMTPEHQQLWPMHIPFPKRVEREIKKRITFTFWIKKENSNLRRWTAPYT